ncbi:MAG: hypothetical protein JWL65_2845 [Gammaproteobacteria bacterium]|nr:hypothetical protein [Gammaproteobacteria bacterium]
MMRYEFARPGENTLVISVQDQQRRVSRYLDLIAPKDRAAGTLWRPKFASSWLLRSGVVYPIGQMQVTRHPNISVGHLHKGVWV